LRRDGEGLDRRDHGRERKKLTAVARALANARAPSEPEEEAFAGLALVGMSPEQIEAYRASRVERQTETAAIDVLFDNWDAVQVFQRCGWQMLAPGMGKPVYVGISALEIQAVARALRVRLDEELLDAVRLIAATVREVWNRRS
jgi:hypothetical protein